MTAEPPISVVVLSHNRRSELEYTLPGLQQGAINGQYELIVVDNASTDGSREMLQSMLEAPHIMALFSSENLGAAAGRNLGVLRASGDYVICLDDDTRATPELIDALAHFAASQPRAGAVFPLIRDEASGRLQVPESTTPTRIGNFPAACFALTRQAIEQVGLLDPACFFGAEELDYSIRLRAAGFDILQASSLEVRHNTLKRAPQEDLSRRLHWSRGFARVLFKNFPIRSALLFTRRLFVSWLLSMQRTHGVWPTLRLIPAVLEGARQGWKERNPVPADVNRWYRCGSVRPEMGNVSLTQKALARLSKRT